MSGIIAQAELPVSEETKPKFEVPWGTLLPVLAALAGIVAQVRPLVSTRPSVPAEKPLPVVARQDVDARLWQDPIAVAQKRKSALLAEMSSGAAPRNRAQDYDISVLVQLLHDRVTNSGGHHLLLLGVMLDAGPYSEQSEARLRARHAVLEGLSESGFVPRDSEHIGYVTSFWPLPDDHFPDLETSVANPTLLVPWEECEALDSPPGTNSVVVLWLPATSFSPDPLKRLARLLDLLVGDIRSQIDVKFLGPENSTGLQAMVREVRAPSWQFEKTGKSLDGIKIISPRATAADDALLHDPDDVDKPKNHPETSIKHLLESSVPNEHGGLRFFRTIATDDVVLRQLIAELRLRHVPVESRRVAATPPPGASPSPNPRLPDVILLTEWDTPYGRSLGTTFFAEAYHEKFDTILARRKRADARPRTGTTRRIHIYRYLRGIDGQLPGDIARETPARSQKDQSQTEIVEATEGLDQADYLRRLAGLLQAQNHRWHLAGDPGIRAIGLLGSDPYDKLMILRALRPEFPEAIFFTNTYDAHFERRDDLDDTHNLVIGSPFGNEAPLLSRRQRVAPFRDSTQTSMFVGTLVATGRLDPAAAEKLARQPRIFEIGRDGAHDLSNPWKIDNQEPLPTRETWFRDWLHSDSVLWHLAGAAFFLALLVGWVSASNARRRLPGGGTTPQRLASVLSSTPFWVVCGPPLIVLAVATFAQGDGASLEPFAFFAGISIWPSEMLRLIAFMLAIHFMIKAGRDLRANEGEIEKRFCLEPLPPKPFRWTDVGLGFELWRLRPNERPGQEDEFPAQDAWHAYLRRNKFWPRFIRIGILFVLYFAFSIFFFTLFPGPVTPARGEVAFRFDSIVLLSSVIGLMILSFYVVDAIQLNSNFIRLFAREVTRWGHEVVEQCRRSPPLSEKELSDYNEIFFVAQRTEVVARLIWYPLIVLTLMIMARFSFFDNWSWPPSLLIVFSINAAWALGSAVYLHRAAEQLRAAAVGNLALLRLGAFTNEVKRKMVEELMVEIRGLRKGAFAPLSEQPFVRAVLFPSGGLGLIAVAQRLFDLL